METVSYNDLVEAIQSATKNHPDADGLTAAEIAAALELGIDTTRARMKLLLEKGLLELAGKRRIRNLAGQQALVPVYKLVEKEMGNERANG